MANRLRVAVVADNERGWPEGGPESSAAQVFITLGDLYARHIEECAATGRPVLGVYGNHCRRGYLERTDGAINLAGERIAAIHRWGELAILGVEGCVRYKPGTGDVLWTQEEYAAVLDPIVEPIDLVVTHCPPRGCNDGEDPAHIGIEALTRLVQRCRPKLILHGHTYPAEPLTHFEGAEVIYVSGWREGVELVI